MECAMRIVHIMGMVLILSQIIDTGQELILANVKNTRSVPLCATDPLDGRLCLNVTNYPRKEVVEEIIHKNMNIFGKFFDQVEEPNDNETTSTTTATSTTTTKTLQIFERLVSQQNDDKTETRVCHFLSKLFVPEAAKDTDNKWRFIAQTNKLVQTIEIEVCSKTDLECDIPSSLPPGQSAFCKQRYSVKTLLAYDDNEEGVVIDKFQFPSACVCYMLYDSSSFIAGYQ